MNQFLKCDIKARERSRRSHTADDATAAHGAPEKLASQVKALEGFHYLYRIKS
ncbi:MAG: hypothetical protein V7642_891 [Burkholderiales bacterium]|jgi:hypothetical protein